jgi:diguanylate cyclase (GGDEF)-like protein
VRAWKAVLRPSDKLARCGGEEFAVLLPDCSLAEALAVIERLRAATPEGQTCSAGLAEYDGTQSGDELVHCADTALYQAKVAGRDRSHVHFAPLAVG